MKVLYEYEIVLHGQVVKVKRYEYKPVVELPDAVPTTQLYSLIVIQ